MNDVFVYYVSLPSHINGITVPNEDTTFDIYINSTLCEGKQQKALEHELRHIKNDHFYEQILNIGAVEKEAM